MLPYESHGKYFAVQLESDGDSLAVTAVDGKGERVTPFRYVTDGKQAHDFIACGMKDIIGATAVEHLIDLTKRDIDSVAERWA